MHKAGNISYLSENMSVGGVKRMIGYGRSECVGDKYLYGISKQKLSQASKVSNFLQLWARFVQKLGSMGSARVTLFLVSNILATFSARIMSSTFLRYQTLVLIKK